HHGLPACAGRPVVPASVAWPAWRARASRPGARPGAIAADATGDNPLADYQNIIVETRGRGGLIALNRPHPPNALNDALMDELGGALLAFDANDDIGAIVITGSEKAFAAGADIAAMAKWDYMDVYRTEYIGRNWETIRKVRKPVIAAVAGFALGG